MSLDYKTLCDGFCVRGQISLTDLQEIKDAGFRSIIINRPDGEAPDQPSAASIKKVAQDIDLNVVYIPMAGQFSMDLIENTQSAIGDLPGPILAYCGSGMRSSMLWCLAQAREKGIDNVLEAASGAGYNLGHIRPTLEHVCAE